MKKRTSITLVISFMLAVTLLVATPKVASATSAYDNAFVIGTMELNCGTSSRHTIPWNAVKAALHGNDSYYDSLFAAAEPNGAYAVYQAFDSSTMNASSISVLVSSQSFPQASFATLSVGYDALFVPYAVRGSVICSGLDSSGDPILTTNINNSIGSMRELGVIVGSYNQAPVFSAMPINYPTGYAGSYVPSSPPSPPVNYYSGTVDCGGTTPPAYVMIVQFGNDGLATMTNVTTGSGRADWSYYLTDNYYGIRVGCDNHISASQWLVDPATASNDWVCDPVEPFYCILS